MVAGTLVLTDEPSPVGDGRVEWSLIGAIDGPPGPGPAGPIFWLGEEFDRVGEHHVTFPGAFRRRAGDPELVAACDADALELAPARPGAPAGAVEQVFGARTWQFRAAAPSEASVGAPAR